MVSEARRFEELVDELSAGFVRATEDQIDHEIKDGTSRSCYHSASIAHR